MALSEMKVIGFRGFSGAGKTTLVEQLVARLRQAGQRVSVVKHAHHTFDIDHEGKDSWRHRQAGAFEVVIASRRRWPARAGLAASPAPARAAKRAFDIAFAGTGLLLSSPLWAVIAIAVKATDGGPVFFRQERVGERGRIFDVLKFRSMIPDAESRTGAVQASGDDWRVTRRGRPATAP